MKGADKQLLEKCNSLIKELRLPDSYLQVVETIFIGLSESIHTLQKASSKPLFISINGAQGTGKSTLTRFLKLILETRFNVNVAEFSLDDFYLTRQERINLSETVHPLFKTRGVPGTHDIHLIEHTLEMLLNEWECLIPAFDKSSDDRLKMQDWKKQSPAQILLFEGWCNHSPYQSDEELESPINELEEKEDADGTWRRHVNNELKLYHERIFSHADLTVMLSPPSFDHIFEWRNLQEEKLRQSNDATGTRIMNQQQVFRFIQHYERITRHSLKNLPEKADVVLPVNDQHEIEAIRYRNDW